MFLRHVVVFSLIALLAGCAGFGARESVEGQGNPAQWKQHKSQLASIDGWQIEGKVGVRAPKDSGSGTLFWLQRQDYYDIRLSGPLGRGAARLTGRASGRACVAVNAFAAGIVISPQLLDADDVTLLLARLGEELREMAAAGEVGLISSRL